MKQKIYDVKTIKQAEKLMAKRADKMQKIQDKRKKISDKMSKLQQELKELNKETDNLPNYSASILLAKEIGAEAFGCNEKGHIVVKKDGKWCHIFKTDGKGEWKLEEIKKVSTRNIERIQNSYKLIDGIDKAIEARKKQELIISASGRF